MPNLDPTTLARIEFRQEIGTFTDTERDALIGQMIMAARNIRDKRWDTIDMVEFSAPEEPARIIVPQ